MILSHLYDANDAKIITCDDGESNFSYIAEQVVRPLKLLESHEKV